MIISAYVYRRPFNEQYIKILRPQIENECDIRENIPTYIMLMWLKVINNIIYNNLPHYTYNPLELRLGYLTLNLTCDMCLIHLSLQHESQTKYRQHVQKRLDSR